MISKMISKQILLVGPDYHDHRGGIAAVIEMHKDQYEVFNFIPSFRSYSSNISKTIFFIRQYFRILIYLFGNTDIKIVHIHSSKKGSLIRKFFILILVKGLFRKKTINHIHSGEFQLFYNNSNAVTRKLITWYLKTNDVTIALSDSWTSYYKSVFNLKEIFTINNIIVNNNTQLIHQKIAGTGIIQFLFLGSIDHHKGIFDLMDVLIDNKDLFDNKIKLVIGGIGKSGLLNDVIMQNGLNNMVEYKGWISGNLKHEKLTKADVFILPSHYEGLPMSILEAMSYGKPVIATTVGGIPEIVRTGINGILVTPGDKEALKNAITMYINDRAMMYRHGEQSVNLAREYSPEIIFPKLEAIYSSMLNKEAVI